MLGDGKSHASRLGYTAPLKCFVGTRVFAFSFAVLTTGSHDVFLGRRFLSEAGIHLANVPRGFASDEMQELPRRARVLNNRESAVLNNTNQRSQHVDLAREGCEGRASAPI